MTARPIRFCEYILCQFPDDLCNAFTVDGTSYCAQHLDTLRRLACAELCDDEQPDPVEMCCVEQADGHTQEAA